MPEQVPIAFVRSGRGWLGEGPVVRGHFAAGDAYREAAAWWSRVVAERRGAGREDPIVAFGSFSFDASSPAGATLLVPERVRRVERGMPRLGALPLPAATVHDGIMSHAAYEEAVDRVRAAIAAGRLEKSVLARDVVVEPAGPVDLGSLLDALASAHPDAAVFCVDGLVGASPETLVTVHDGIATARVLAGTAGPGEAEALAGSDKDRHEHELAARSVTEALAPHVVRLEATEPYVLELPHLTHLATDVRAEISDGSDVLALVAALHPTAAVAGTPVGAALDWIHEVEPVDRGRYSGPVGWVDANGDGEWAIALRCAQLRADGTFQAFAGAGIMADSVPELELAETELKLRPILEALGAAR
ncbi:MAG TPA: chorismate-binding protein [Microbacteriaceae bacterium]|nr:chorismate-binding protein [Microbacteriaceae bacterium]